MKNQTNVVICPPCGESVAVATKEGQNRNKTSWPLLPRLAAVLPPQGREMRRGFTLIELLVVVLIIGILAAVAVPQYKAAVLKARSVEAMIALNTLERAQRVYALAHGDYTNRLNNLDVQVTVPILDNSSNYGKVKVSNDLFLEWVWVFNPTEHRCIASSPVAHRVCRSLGGNPMNHSQNTATKTYYRIP